VSAPGVAGRATILINNFNYGAFLAEAIDSALGQDWPDVEVVVVDDGSTDDSRDVIASYGERIVPVLQENRGQASTFNAGFACATGEVVLLLDADDWFVPHKARRVMDVLAGQERLGWCFHPLDYLGGPGVVPPGPLGVEVDARAALRRGRPHGAFAPATSGLCFTSALLERILPMPEDFRVPHPSGARGTAADAYVKIAALGLAPGMVLDDRLAVQRLHGANAYTGTRWADPKRAVLELLIASELRERWPELRAHAFRKGIGGLQRLAAIGEVEPAVTAVATAFIDGCTKVERARIRVHEVQWRVRGVPQESIRG
jgi:CTP:molybdopterin cytidylyltransferase MocA